MRTRPHKETWLKRPPRATVSRTLRPWLTDPDSLTARIRARCSTFAVRVLRQRLALPHRDEATLLGLRRGELAWLREVLLVADGVPVVFARSLLPRPNVRGAWNLFHGMGARPLGAALFADPAISRRALTCACLDRRDARYHLAAAAVTPMAMPPRAWARRSLFRLHGRALLVSEAFLPTILDLPE
ncbi:chorismate--pyruvate lyase family protein [Aromatoleum evansii]|uniref:chorismate--pyruvate lyase family protein n=1 Tax=Aromatoleum evansii TaxID=59406 RepID=UPI00145CAFB8|nr:chorismate lyase [Aromatoleum evansii]NMG28683.1 chorismate lyase [Aromatoleum evansii]